MATQHHDIINGLIATYRELNSRLRPLPEERLALQGRDAGSVRQEVTRLRDNELHFSQALKEAISGVPMVALSDHEVAPVLGTESSDDTTVIILSQFGTARESTLAMLRTLPAQDWDRPVIEGGASIRSRTEEHLARDKRSMEQIIGLLGAP